MNRELNDLSAEIKKELTKKRFLHTVRVTVTAQALAMSYGMETETAGIAGILHDCAKCIPDDEKLSLCKQYGLGISPSEAAYPDLLHSKLGAFLAAKKYGITDEDVLAAITYHTTGRPEMTFLEKIIFVADYIEPGRPDLPKITEIRELAFHNLDKCVYLIMENTLNYLEAEKQTIDKMTIAARDYYREQVEKQESIV
ncbi:putative HD superfamily hydrolase involved in NAD metabolism [Lachnospiraceae bacterium PFB1-21]